jgi:hypothetical protein
MAQLRLIAVLLAGCGQANAQPTLAGPSGWPAIGDIATPMATAAKSEGVTVGAAGAWGDTARGCYAVALELKGGPAKADALGEQVLAALTTEGIASRDVVPPPAEGGTLAFSFLRAPYDGRVRAELSSDGRIGARACFWNEREPKACEAACAGWLK